jgi:plasmid stabilization system protein ParE
MPRGDKSKYTDKQERKADHIKEHYEEQGVSEKEAERRAWATNPAAGEVSSSRPAEERSRSAKKAAVTRKRHEEQAH